MARIVEQLTPLIISINVRNKVRAGIKITGPVSGPVVVLAGGTGGAKLARGMLDVVGPDELVVIANTGDDIEIYGAHVSPDPDLVTFWLADLIDERGWGLRGRHVPRDGRAARRSGVEVWFNLGDRDLAIGCIERAGRCDDGARLTEAHARDRRGARRPGARAADERRAGPHPRARPTGAGGRFRSS